MSWGEFDYPISSFFDKQGSWDCGQLNEDGELKENKRVSLHRLLDYSKFSDVYYSRPGEHDGDHWLFLVRHIDGFYISFDASCDFTGFDCAGCGTIAYSKDPSLTWRYGLTKELREKIASECKDLAALRTFDSNIVLKKCEYKFRAETIVDVAHLLKAPDFSQILESITISTDEDGLPDVDVELKTVDWCNLDHLRGVIERSRIPDLHVILDTVNYAEVYTGERRQ